jgi:heme-degrading monooxygenase HmoA
MSEIWTHGRWKVKTGREQEFERAWRELAEWSLQEFEGARGARLVRDRDEPNRYYSFGTWDSPETVARWRDHRGFAEGIERIQEFIEELEPVTAEAVEAVGELA